MADWLRGRGATQAAVVFLTRAPTPDSRFVRARGFWKVRPDAFQLVPADAELYEQLIEGPDGLRWLASAQADIHQLPSLVSAAHGFERLGACVLVPLTRPAPALPLSSVRHALSHARYEAQIIEDTLAAARAAATVVVVPFGRFDDHDCGLLVGGPVDDAAASAGLVVST